MVLNVDVEVDWIKCQEYLLFGSKAMSGRQRIIADGLKALQEEVKNYALGALLKLQAMQDAYFTRTNIAYSSSEKEAIQYYLNALKHKLYMATLSLEQLWALSYKTRDRLYEAVVQSLDRLDVSEDELALISFAFDTFPFHARSYIDFYMLYICYFLRTGHEGSISRDRFRKALQRVSDPTLKLKAAKVQQYFDNRVFGKYDGKSFQVTSWGTLITSLRDKIAHRDIVRPSFESGETLAKKVLFDWPTIQDTTYERFHQDMQSGMFFLVTELSPILYEVEWIPGPYRPGMYNSE
jgi:hypothetical protein